MVNLKTAFNYIINLKGKTITIKRMPSTQGDIKIADSNYFRFLAGPSETVIPGKEFVVTKDGLDSISFPEPKRGDMIIDSVLSKTDTITSVIPLFLPGGELAGYRLRTS